MPREAVIGPAIFDRVNELINKEHMSKIEAIHKIAQERKMNWGTVSANYYRVARGRGIGRGKGKNNNKLDRLLNRLDALTIDIHDEVDRLNRRYARLEKLQTLIEGAKNDREG